MLDCICTTLDIEDSNDEAAPAASQPIVKTTATAAKNPLQITEIINYL